MKFLRKRLESITWLLALLLLFFLDPVSEDFSFCLFSSLGVDSCPGCGLGHSIHYALRLDIGASFSEHLLGPFVTVLLLFKALRTLAYLKPNNHGHQTNVGHPS